MQRKRGLELGRPFGFPLLVHRSWFPAGALFTVHLSVASFGGDSLPVAVTLGAMGAVAFFVGVVVHELGHELLRRRIGLRTIDTTLFVFGEVSRTSQTQSVAEEISVALAGPLTSGAVGLAFLLGSTTLSAQSADVLWTVGVANLVFSGLNLLPALPLDGGRVLVAVIWKMSGDRGRGVHLSSRAGELLGMAGVLGGVWLVATSFTEPEDAALGLWLALSGGFVFSEAARIRRAAAVADALEEGTVGGWARPFAGRVRLESPVPTEGGPYAVADGGRLAGVLLSRRSRGGGRTRAGDAMIPWTPDMALRTDEPIVSAMAKLVSIPNGALIVLDEEGVVRGVLDSDGIRERLRKR